MKSIVCLAALVLAGLSLSSCGGGGGTGTPAGIGDQVVSAIQSEAFERLYSLQPLHLTESADHEAERRKWLMDEGYLRWKDAEIEIKGHPDGASEASDPQGKSGITNAETWGEASQAKLYALDAGCYRLYAIAQFDARVKEARFYLTRPPLVKQIMEDRGLWENRSATLTYENKFGDAITVECLEDQGAWYMTRLRLNFREKLPAKPEN